MFQPGEVNECPMGSKDNPWDKAIIKKKLDKFPQCSSESLINGQQCLADEPLPDGTPLTKKNKNTCPWSWAGEVNLFKCIKGKCFETMFPEIFSVGIYRKIK